MRRTLLILGAGAAVVLVAVLEANDRRTPEALGPTATLGEVGRGRLELWTTLLGELQAADSTEIVTRGAATLIEIAPEGRRVRAGDVVARFDDSAAQRDLIRLEQDLALARTDLDGLVRATQPIELAELGAARRAAEQEFAREQAFLTESEALAAEGLLSAAEAAEARDRVEALRAERAAAVAKDDLTRRWLHPTQRQRAEARVRAAEQAFALGRMQVADRVVRAPAAGVVVLRPLQVGSEFRAARVGDSLPANAVLGTVSDPSRLVARALVAETDLARLSVDASVTLRPLAYPDLGLPGRLRSIGGAAQFVPGRPSWQRFFTVEIAFEQSDPRLRPGMSVEARVLGQVRDAAVLVPRSAVRWGPEGPRVTRVHALYDREQVIQVGLADERHYEVLAGLDPGDEVRLP